MKMEKMPLKELPYFARNVLATLSLQEHKDSATIVALRGNLGAGKTTFAQALAKELGVRDLLQSPTYVLMKSYPVEFDHFTMLVHIDAYRLEKPEEFRTLKPETFLHDSQTFVLIEWPEKVEGILPKADMTIEFSSEGAEESERFIKLT
jgi:tRNA threonylcarbamoyladenosine biosynthesis protein TsaE